MGSRLFDMTPTASNTARAEAVVGLPPIEIWHAFTRPVHLSYWLGDAIEIDLRVGGAYIVRCSSGARLDTTVERLLEGRRLVLRPMHRGDDDRIEIDLVKLAGAETKISVCDPTDGEPWRHALENLRSVWERGVDLRETKIAVMGIDPRDFRPGERPVRGVPPGAGVRLQAILRGGPADQAGLRGGDVLLAFGDIPVRSTAELIQCIRSKAPGDSVVIRAVRDGEECERTVIFRSRPGRGEPPPDRGRLARTLHENVRQADAALEKAVEGISDSDAYLPEGPEAWSVAQVLAHLSVTERALQCWLDQTARGERFVIDDSGVTYPPRIAAALEGRPKVSDLLNRLKRDERETIAYLEHLPASVTGFRPLWARVAFLALDYQTHSEDHLAQIRRIRQTLNV